MRQRPFFLYNNATRRFIEITDGFVCGRTEGDFQVPSDNLVSRRQCRLLVRKNIVYLEDLGSTNITKVNGVPLEQKKPRKLYLNDVVEFGMCRLILCPSNTAVPGHIQDRFGPAKPLRAARRKDGSLTSEISGIITKTLVLLTPKSYRSLRVKEFSELRGWDFSTVLTGVVILGGWLGAIRFGYQHGALGDYGTFRGFTLLLKLFLLGACAAFLFMFAHYYLVRRAVRSGLKRSLFVPLWGTIAAVSATLIALTTDFYSDLQTNTLGHYCIANFQPARCALLARELPGFNRLPEETRNSISARLNEAAARR